MKKILVIILLFTAFAFNTYAQQALIKLSAQAMLNSTIKGDYNTLANYTYPKILSAMGGRDKMIATLKTGIGQMKAQGIDFKSGSIGEPGKIITNNGLQFCVVPEHIVMKVKGGELTTQSSLLAVSSDKGKSWKFIDASNMSPEMLHSVFPGLNIEIPKAGKPVFKQTLN